MTFVRYCMSASRCQNASKFGCSTKSFHVGRDSCRYFGIDVRERALRQPPAIVVVLVELERRALFAPFHHHGILEAVREPERAVVMEVVAEEHRRRRCLRRRGLERGMRIEDRHHCQPAGVRNTELPDAAVVVRHVLEQPLDRVVRVRRFVDRLRVALVLAQRPQHHELPFGRVAAANVLEDEDVALVRQLGVRRSKRAASARDAVRCARQNERQIPARVLRPENRRVQLDPVPHRDHHLTGVERPRGRGRLPRGHLSDEQEQQLSAKLHAMPSPRSSAAGNPPCGCRGRASVCE